jgi:hypothetical protein
MSQSVNERVEVHEATAKEGRALLDRAARHYLGMSGAAFIRAWEAGEFRRQAERPEVVRVAMLLPFGR